MTPRAPVTASSVVAPAATEPLNGTEGTPDPSAADGRTSLVAPPPASAPFSASPARLRYLEALAAASNAINASLDLEKVLEVLADKTLSLLEVPAVSVMLIAERSSAASDGPTVRTVAARGLSAAYVEAQHGLLEDSIAGRALAEERTFATWDVRQTADERIAAAAAREGISSVACAPMFFAGRPLGTLNLYCKNEPRCFSEDQFHILSLLAAQGAVAISNARLYKESRARAGEVRAGFQRVGTALAASLDLGETLRLIVQLAVEMTRAEGGAFFMLRDGSENSGGLVLSAARGIDRRSIRRIRRLVQPSPIAKKALAERRVVVVPDTRRQSDTAFPTLRLPVGDQVVETRSVVCVPVLAGERPVGVLEQYSSFPGRFERGDLQLLSSFALQAAVAIENSRLYAQEKNLAQTLQRAFLPELPPAVGGFQIGRLYAPGSEEAQVGGDTYDLFTLSDGRLAVLMADVSGQGALAATLTVMAKYTVRAYALEEPAPAVVLARTNDALVRQTGDSTFLTLCYALLDPRTRSVRVASAAHPPALFCRPGHKCQRLGALPGLIAGFRSGETYTEDQAVFGSGDVLVFYTDGVTEARRKASPLASSTPRPQFEMERLQRVIEANVSLSAQEIAHAIHAAVADHAAGNLSDDIALLVLKAD